jgi:hypothetical protein
MSKGPSEVSFMFVLVATRVVGLSFVSPLHSALQSHSLGLPRLPVPSCRKHPSQIVPNVVNGFSIA